MPGEVKVVGEVGVVEEVGEVGEVGREAGEPGEGVDRRWFLSVFVDAYEASTETKT